MSDFQVKKSDTVLLEKKSLARKVVILILSFVDFFSLIFKSLSFGKKKTKIYFTHSSFIKKEGNKNVDVLYNEILDVKNSIFISYDKFNYFDKVNDVKVYNLAVIVRVLDFLNIIKSESKLKNFTRWKFITEQLTKILNENLIYIPAYSNETGLSLLFNKYRDNYTLIEMQHGSVVNYPPYSFISEIPLVDVFYYKDERSKMFLLQNLFAKHPPKMIIMQSKKLEFLPATAMKELLYISSFEYNGFHPVFEDFLKTKPVNCHVRVRLHPRQNDIAQTFIQKLEENKINFTIDTSKYWYDLTPINTTVVSPFSSVIEEAVTAGLKTIIIDAVGATRFDYLIDGKNCIFSNNLPDLNLIQ